MIAVVSNKGGVGKTTVATNLAIYLRALRENLPILLVGLDEQLTIDRMFCIEGTDSGADVADALRDGDLAPAIRLGQYGVSYVPSSTQVAALKGEIRTPSRLDRVLRRTGWQGLVIVDTKSDLEILTLNALAASDLAIVVVRDQASVYEAEKVFELFDRWGRPRRHGRVLFSLVDLRLKYEREEQRDVLALLLAEMRKRNLPHFPTFISSSPKVESLYTNPEGRVHSIMHAAGGSVVHRQMGALAKDVMAVLDSLTPPPPLPILPATPVPSRAAVQPVPERGPGTEREPARIGPAGAPEIRAPRAAPPVGSSAPAPRLELPPRRHETELQETAGFQIWGHSPVLFIGAVAVWVALFWWWGAFDGR